MTSKSRSCGAVMNDIERQRCHFEKIAKNYFQARKNRNSLEIKKEIWKFFFNQFNKYFEVEPASRVYILDAMCGALDNHEYFVQMFPNDFSYDAFDYSPTMIEFARHNHPDLHIFNEDICKIHFIEAYDIVVLIGGLHHVYKNVACALANIAKALKPGGFFISFEPTNNNFLTKLIRNITYKTNSLFDEATEHGFTTKELDTLCHAAGLEKIFQFYPGLLAYILWYNPDAFPLLNVGKTNFVKKLVAFEKKFWTHPLACFFSFATFTCYARTATPDPS